MIGESQKYPTLNCKKVKKVKTTSLKLFDQKDQKTQFERTDLQNQHTSLHDTKISQINQDFAYLGQSKGAVSEQKSFEQIMKQTRKFLQMRKKIEQDEKKREQQKMDKKSKKKQKKQQKAQKKNKKTKQNKSQKETNQEETIQLSPLDIQRFETENESIKNIIDKIKLLQNISNKCNIISPLLFSLNSKEKNCQNSEKEPKDNFKKAGLNQQVLSELQQLEMQIQLMKKNLQQTTDKKDILNPFQINEFCKWEIQSRKDNQLSPSHEPSPLIKKYIDKENEKFYAQELENELEFMQNSIFSKEEKQQSSQ